MKKHPADKHVLKELYHYLVRIRKFEEKVIKHYPEQEMRCPVHLYIGQEAIAVGFSIHLRKEDYVFSTHRNHGHFIAKGADLKPLFAEFYGKRTGCSSGKGGSMHMICLERSILGTSAIVSGSIPIAVGAALGSKMKKDGRVVISFFGDAAVEEGTFYESLNFSALHKLPIVFVCENNFYATNSPQKNRQANIDIYKIADSFLIPGELIDGNDVLETYESGMRCVERARKGLGPSLVEARTFRWRTHVGPETDIEKGLRDKEEVEAWMKKCPLKQFRNYLLTNSLLTEDVLNEEDRVIDQEVCSAHDFAVKSPCPTEEDLYKDVY